LIQGNVPGDARQLILNVDLQGIAGGDIGRPDDRYAQESEEPEQEKGSLPQYPSCK
jgi:hypothetical protein